MKYVTELRFEGSRRWGNVCDDTEHFLLLWRKQPGIMCFSPKANISCHKYNDTAFWGVLNCSDDDGNSRLYEM